MSHYRNQMKTAALFRERPVSELETKRKRPKQPGRFGPTSSIRCLASLLPAARATAIGQHFFALGKTVLPFLPALEGGCTRLHIISARPLWYRSRASATGQRFFAFGKTAPPSLPALCSTYPTGAGGSPAAPWLPLRQEDVSMASSGYRSLSDYKVETNIRPVRDHNLLYRWHRPERDGHTPASTSTIQSLESNFRAQYSPGREALRTPVPPGVHSATETTQRWFHAYWLHALP